MTDKTTNIPLQEEESDDKTPSQKQRLSRRQALLGALLAGAIAKPAEAATDGSCACLPAPDCNAVCPNGGVPRGDGTQACECTPAPNFPRALGVVDGGDAVKALDSDRWGGRRLRLNHNTTDTWIPVFSGENVDYVLKSEIGGAGQKIGAKILWGTKVLHTENCRSGYSYGSGNCATYPIEDVAVRRDDYGRVIEVGKVTRYTQCRCNCDCQCSDDNGCFITARLRTTKGIKAVEDLQVGDRLIGIDGIHTVVGMATNYLYGRKAISPLSDLSVVLTEEHIVIADGGMPVVQSMEMIERNKITLCDDNNDVQGKYVWPFMSLQIKESPESFTVIELPERTKTYTPIVADGHWGMTESGTSVLLCCALKD